MSQPRPAQRIFRVRASRDRGLHRRLKRFGNNVKSDELLDLVRRVLSQKKFHANGMPRLLLSEPATMPSPRPSPLPFGEGLRRRRLFESNTA